MPLRIGPYKPLFYKGSMQCSPDIDYYPLVVFTKIKYSFQNVNNTNLSTGELSWTWNNLVYIHGMEQYVIDKNDTGVKGGLHERGSTCFEALLLSGPNFPISGSAANTDSINSIYPKVCPITLSVTEERNFVSGTCLKYINYLV